LGPKEIPPWRWCGRRISALSASAGALLASRLDRGAADLAARLRVSAAGAPVGQLSQQGLAQRRAVRRQAEYRVVGVDDFDLRAAMS
jgi:hypothetical protein